MDYLGLPHKITGSRDPQSSDLLASGVQPFKSQPTHGQLIFNFKCLLMQLLYFIQYWGALLGYTKISLVFWDPRSAQQQLQGCSLISTSAFLFCPLTSQHVRCSTAPPHTAFNLSYLLNSTVSVFLLFVIPCTTCSCFLFFAPFVCLEHCLLLMSLWSLMSPAARSQLLPYCGACRTAASDHACLPDIKFCVVTPSGEATPSLAACPATKKPVYWTAR